MSVESKSLGNVVISMLDDGMRRDDIIESLIGKGHDERFVRELVAESSKLRDTKRRAQGLALILGGALICFLSFLLTITSSFTSTSFPYVLYGVTSLGVLVVFAGLMKVF